MTSPTSLVVDPHEADSEAPTSSADASVEPSTPAATSPRRKLLKLGITALVLGACWLVAELTGAREAITLESLRAWVDGAGPYGVFGLIAAFSVGLLLQVPGVLFIAAARFAYGPWLGFFVAYGGALIAVSLSFFIVRSTGGKALDGIKFRPLARMLEHLDQYPMRTIAALRAILWVAPPLNYALAMSRVRFRDYFLGSAVGLAAPIAVLVFLADRVFVCLGVMG